MSNTTVKHRLAIIALAVVVLGVTCSRCENERSGPWVEIPEEFTLRYGEGKVYVDFTYEYLVRGRAVAYVPAEHRWLVEMPDWARQRRDEILANMKRLCKARGWDFTFEDYG